MADRRKRADLLNFDRGEDYEGPYARKLREEEEQRRKEEEQRRLHPDFSNVQGTPTPAPPEPATRGWGGVFDGGVFDKIETFGRGNQAALAGGLENSAAGLLTLSADPNAAPDAMGGAVLRWEDALLQEHAPGYYSDLVALRKRILNTRDALVERAKTNQQAAEASRKGIKTEVGRQAAEAIQDFAGSPTSTLSVFGGPAASGITGLDVYGQEYMQATMAGVDPETARARAGLMAGLESGISAIPAGQFLSRIPGVRNLVGRVGRDLLKDDLAKIAGRTVRTTLGEAAEEGVTTIGQLGADKAINMLAEDKDTQMFTEQNTVDFWNQVWRATKAGAVGGAAIGAPHSSFEVAREAGKLASDAQVGQAAQRAYIEASRIEDARIADEKARLFKQRENEIAIDPQRKADEEEAAFRTQERINQAQRLARGASLDQQPSAMQEAMKNIKVVPVTAEDIAAERKAKEQAAQVQKQQEKVAQAQVQQQQAADGKTAAQALIQEDAKKIDTKAKSMRQAARRKALQGIMDETRSLEPEARVDAVAQRVAEWEAANPLENYVAQATAKPIKRAPTQGAPRVTPAPVTQPAVPAPVTPTETTAEEAPKRTIEELKKELNMASLPVAAKAEPERGVSSEQAMNTLVENVGKGDAKKVLKLIADGNAVILDSETDVPAGAAPAGSGAFYDGKRTYILANQLRKDNVMGDLLTYAAHETKHAADVSGNKTLKATMGQFIGDKANADIRRKIEAMAAQNNPVAKEVIRMAREGSVDDRTYQLELPAYFINYVMEHRATTGTPRRVAGDIVSAVRTKYKEMKGGDPDINLKDVGYLANKLVEEAGLSGERLTGDVNAPLPMIMGKKAPLYQKFKEKGLTYTSYDGKEKFVVTDADAYLKPTVIDGTNSSWNDKLAALEPVPLTDILEHDILYTQYPNALDIRVKVDPKLRDNNGYWDNNTGIIAIASNLANPGRRSSLLDLIIHEAQHFIQDQEGHAFGGNPSMFLTDADQELYNKHKSVMDRLAGFQQLVGTKARISDEMGTLPPTLGRQLDDVFMNYLGLKSITRIEFLEGVGRALLSEPNLPQNFKTKIQSMMAAVTSARNLGQALNERNAQLTDQYKHLLGEAEARFSADSRGLRQEALPVNPEDLGPDNPRGFDVETDKLLVGERGPKGTWKVEDLRGNLISSSRTWAGRTGLSSQALGSAVTRFTQPDNQATRTILNGIKVIGGQLKTYGNLGQELGVMKEEADGEAALHSHRAMNYFTWLNRGVDRMASAGVKSGKYKNKAEGVTAIKSLIQDQMNKIAALPDETRRAAALAAFVRQNPELDGLMSAVQEVNQLSRTILKQMIQTTPNPTNEELRLMNTIMDNSFRYTTQMYAAFQGPAGRAHSQQIIDEYDRAKRLLAAGKQVDAKLAKSFNTYKNAMKFLIDNDLTIPDVATMESSSTEKLMMLYDSWIGDASRLARTTKEAGVAQGLTIRQADQLVRDTLIAALEQKAPGISNTDYEGKARDLILGMLELSNEGGPFASYYRGFKQDRSILEQRVGLPQEIKDLFGEITDPATRLAVTIAKQGELVARTRMLLDMRDNGLGKWVIPAAEAGLEGNEKFTATLKGENYGPLNGYRTTPEIASAISDNLEMFSTLTDALAQSYQNSQPAIEAAARTIVGGLRGAAAWQKVLTVVFDLYNMGTNFAGSFIALGANGIWNPIRWWKGAGVAMDVVIDSVYTKSGQLTPEFEDAVKYGILDSARVQEIRKTPQRYVKELISVSPKAVNAAGKTLSKFKSGTVEAFAMSDAWVKIVAFQDRVKHLTDFYAAEGINKSEDAIKKEAADHIKNTNITYSRTPPLVRNLESVGVTTFMPYFVSVPRAITHNLVLGIQDTIRATGAKTAKGKALMMYSGIKRITGAYAASMGTVMLMKAIAAAVNGDDDDEVEEMKKLLYPDARFADSFFLGKDAAGNPMFARFSRIDPFGPANDLLRIAIDDEITPAEKRRHMVEMLKDMVITNRVVVSGAKALIDIVADEDVKDKKTKIEKISGKWGERTKDLILKTPGLDYNDVNSVLQFVDSFTPGILDMFDPSNRGVSEPKGKAEQITSDLVVWSGGRLDVADSGIAAYRVGKEVEEARETGRKRLAQGVSTGRDMRELANVFIESAAKEQTAMQEAHRVYQGLTKGLGMTPRQASTVLKDDANLTQVDIANIRQGRVNQELEEWLNTGTRMLSKSSLRGRQDQGLAPAEQQDQKDKRKAFIAEMKALGYKVREK